MNIATVVGARPQFVKASMITRALRASGVRETLIHTGQHYDDEMSDVFFRDLEIASPTFNLGVGSGPHGAQTGRMLEKLESVFAAERSSLLIVYGDTNSTLAAALAAAKLQIPIAHVEAGLRSFDRRVPEETNRVLTDHMSDLLFAPTATGLRNLGREGIESSKSHLVGDVMYDAALYYGAKAERESEILRDLDLQPGQYLLATIHRAENTDNIDRLAALATAFLDVARDLPVILPLHPRTKTVLSKAALLGDVCDAIRVIPPVGYLDMMMLEKNARLVATDSGGVQKEAFFYNVPCITLRDHTEWTELVELGWNRVTPPSSASRIAEVLRDALTWTPPACASPFGDGHSAQRIVSIIQDFLSNEKADVLVSAEH